VADLVTERRGVPVLVCGDQGAPIASTYGPGWEIIQKFVNYRMRLAIVGDISAYVAARTACAPWCSNPTGATRSGSSPTWTSSIPLG
jgi:hypothetical protein